jgi:hypothetical protein
MTRLWLGLAFAILAVGTVAVFLAIDAGSHSASDTIRPFLLTMVPVWLIAAACARVVLARRPEGR